MGFKLVIADDAPFIREVVRNLLRGSDIEVIAEAKDGEEAVRIVTEKKPDLVLMDLIMPKKNGVEAASEILAVFNKVKIVACSTESQESLVLKALDAGCCSFIAKPFDGKELLKVLRAAVNANQGEATNTKGVK